MNLEHYKNFVTIVDTGTISGAAEKLLIAQPALSKQIQMLEEKYGTQLIIRKPRRVELTDAGKILYDKVKSITYLEDAAQKEIDACVLGNRGTLWIGRTPGNLGATFHDVLMDFHITYPGIQFEIMERNSGQLIEMLRSGMIEVAVIRSQRYIAPELRTALMIKEPIMAYYHKDHPMFGDRAGDIDIEELRDWPISISNGIKSEFSYECESAGFHPNYFSQSGSRNVSMMWADDKRTICIIVAPKPFDDGDYRCRRINMTGADTIRALVTLRRREPSAVATNFIKFCQKHALLKDWQDGRILEKN